MGSNKRDAELDPLAFEILTVAGMPFRVYSNTGRADSGACRLRCAFLFFALPFLQLTSLPSLQVPAARLLSHPVTLTTTRGAMVRAGSCVTRGVSKS